MSRWYLDTSAALKLVVRESETAALQRQIDAVKPDLVGCWLLDTEMRRAALRHPGVTQELVSDLLDEIDLYEMPASLFRQAGIFPGANLRSLDALHLAAVVQLDPDHLITYDTQLASSARSLGLSVLAPA